MRLTRKLPPIALVVALLAVVVQAAAGELPGRSPDAIAKPSGTAGGVRGSYTVTLLTGDRVTLASAGALSGAVHPAKGREKMAFLTRRIDGHLYVVPQDAQRLVAAGRLDQRLFDVTELVRLGYHDAALDTLPLLVTYRAGATRAAGVALARTGATVTRELPGIGAAAITADKATMPALWTVAASNGGVEKLWLDGKRRISLDRSVAQIGAPAAWQAGYTGSGVTVAVLARPVLDLRASTTLTLDARLAKPVVMTVPDPSARSAVANVGYSFLTASDEHVFSVLAPDLDGLSTAQLGAAAPPTAFVAHLSAQWAKPDAEGRFDNSPYLYAVGEHTRGRFPTGFTRHYRARDLAGIHQEFSAPQPGLTGERMVFPRFDHFAVPWAAVLPTSLPGRRVEYHNTNGVRWDSTLTLGVRDQDGVFAARGEWASPVKRYQAGQRYRDRWVGAPFGPALLRVNGMPSEVTRTGDRISAFAGLHGDAGGHTGWLFNRTGRTALYRDGVLLAENSWPAGEFTVPPDPAAYRLEVSGTGGLGELSSEVSAVWTFNSAHTAAKTALPLSTVHFAPKLDGDQSAASGQVVEFHVSVRRQPDAAQTDLAALTVDVSYDDGGTWQPVTLRRDGDRWLATVTHPDVAGYVSLRATATDSAGNTVKQRIVRAYRIR
jgi:hypothetical protein